LGKACEKNVMDEWQERYDRNPRRVKTVDEEGRL